MKFRAVVAVLIIAVSGCGVAPTPPRSLLPQSAMGKVWMHVDGAWVHPPADLGYPSDYGSAPATLTRFTTNSEFSMLQCWIIQNDKKLSISSGDPHRVFIGRWTTNDSNVTVSYRLVYELVQPVGGGQYPGAEQKASLAIINNTIKLAGVTYTKAAVDPRNYEEFIGPERAKLRAAK